MEVEEAGPIASDKNLHARNTRLKGLGNEEGKTRWEYWFYSIERSQELENTIKRTMLCKIPFKDANVT